MPDFREVIPGTRTSHASLAELQAAMTAGELTSAELTSFYLQRIDRLNPALHAVITVNLNAGSEAAASDAARARSLLRARGVRPPTSGPRSAPDWPELTESEFAVVSLVAMGATNREVADRLFLSPYTVNSHLRHVFAKLGIRSRVELARLSAERGSTG